MLIQPSFAETSAGPPWWSRRVFRAARKGDVMEILVVTFSLDGMSDAEYSRLAEEVAPAFAGVDGLLSKVWLADRVEGVYGGIYTFSDSAALDAFLSSELFAGVGATPGLAGVAVRRFTVLTGPTAVTHGLVGASA